MRILHCWALSAALILSAGGATAQDASPSSAANPSNTYPDTAEGLKALLTDGVAYAQRDDKKRLKSLIESTEIPDHQTWLRENHKSSSPNGIDVYARDLDLRHEEFAAALKFMGSEPGEIIVHKFIDGPDASMMDRVLATGGNGPLDLYWAGWEPSQKTEPSTGVELILGYFYFLRGGFRWYSVMYTPNRPRIQVPAIYPYPAGENHPAGTVALVLHLEPDGSVSPGNVSLSPYHFPGFQTDPMLVEAAKKAVVQWRYFPPAIFDSRKPFVSASVWVAPYPPPNPAGPPKIVGIPIAH